MEKINQQIVENIKSFCIAYEANHYEPLSFKAQKIMGTLKELIESGISDLVNGRDFFLSYRIKEQDSLHEKIIRKNRTNLFIEKVDIETIISTEDFCDDLIGIAIKVPIKTDVDRINDVLSLIFTPTQDDSKRKGIELFYTKDKGISRMKNGAQFYKVKGKFENSRFELQIKSSIFSTWSDIEHSLFYKGHEYYYEKDNNRKIMNNLGRVLLDSESIMSDVNYTKRHFEQAYALQRLVMDIDHEYSKKLSYTIGTTIPADQFSGFIEFAFGQRINDCHSQLKDHSLDMAFYMCKVTSSSPTFISNYEKIRQMDFRFGYQEFIFRLIEEVCFQHTFSYEGFLEKSTAFLSYLYSKRKGINMEADTVLSESMSRLFSSLDFPIESNTYTFNLVRFSVFQMAYEFLSSAYSETNDGSWDIDTLKPDTENDEQTLIDMIIKNLFQLVYCKDDECDWNDEQGNNELFMKLNGIRDYDPYIDFRKKLETDEIDDFDSIIDLIIRRVNKHFGRIGD